jgi:hypothetical protein
VQGRGGPYRCHADQPGNEVLAVLGKWSGYEDRKRAERRLLQPGDLSLGETKLRQQPDRD